MGFHVVSTYNYNYLLLCVAYDVSSGYSYVAS